MGIIAPPFRLPSPLGLADGGTGGKTIKKVRLGLGLENRPMTTAQRLALGQGGPDRVIDTTLGKVVFRHGAAWYDIAGALVDTNLYMLCCGRYGPTNRRWQATSNTTRFRLSQTVFAGAPYIMKGTRFCFTNFYSFGAGTPGEQAAGNAKTITAAAVLINGTWTQITFSASNSVTIPDSGYVWSDPLSVDIPANTTTFVRVADNVALNEYHLARYEILTHLGEGIEYSSAAFTSRVTDGSAITVSGSATGSRAYSYGPAAVASKGWDGRPVALVFGDSLAEGSTQLPVQTANSRGLRAYTMVGLDDTTVERTPFLSLANGSARCQDFFSVNPADQNFDKRYAMLNALGNVPFTHILTQMGVNSATDYPTWKAALDTYWSFLNSLWTGIPIIQTTLTPRTNSANNAYYSNAADQTWSNGNDGPGPGGAREQINAYIATKPAPLTDVIDVRPYFTGGTGLDVWKAQAFSATLAADAAIGATSVSLSAAPEVGAILVFEPGSTNGEMVNAVSAVSGTGPYTVTLSSALAKAHATGTSLLESPTVDGTHASAANARRSGVAAFNASRSVAFA